MKCKISLLFTIFMRRNWISQSSQFLLLLNEEKQDINFLNVLKLTRSNEIASHRNKISFFG